MSFLKFTPLKKDISEMFLTCNKDIKDNKDIYIREDTDQMWAKMFARHSESNDSVRGTV